MTSSVQSLIDLLPEAMAVVSPNGVIRAANRAFVRIIGENRNAIVGKTLDEVGWSRSDGWPEYLRHCARSRTLVLGAAVYGRSSEPFRCDGALLEPATRDGDATIVLRLLPHEASSARFVALTHKIAELSGEITRRRRAELELREQRELLHVTLTSIGDAVIATDPVGRLTFMNDVAAQLTGWHPSDAIGRSIGDIFRIISEETRAPVENPVEKVLALGQIVGLANHTLLIARDGTERPIDDSGAPILDASGRLHGVVLVFRDVTELRIAQRKELAARQAAEAASRAKDEFLATLSHELRTPLNAILGWARILRHGMVDDSKRAHALAVIERNADMQARLIEDLLDMSRIMVGQLKLQCEPVDLRQVIESALDAVRPAIDNKSLRVSTAIAVSSAMYGDAARLEQVIWNLLSNAVKFTPPDGRISVEAVEEPGRVRIVVADSGQGISPSFTPYVFDAFAQADGSFARPHGGLGIGLTIVRRLVEAHGGQVTAESAGANQGATFTVLLPLGRAPAAAEPPRAAARDRDLRGCRILLVEDDADSAELTKMLLEREGADVVVRGRARDALDVLQQTRVDLLVADIGLPHDDGLWLIREVRTRETQHRLPAVALTAFAGLRDRQAALAAGYDEHVSKPLDLDLLLSRIEQVRFRNRPS